jgi:hypothetical protein
MRQRKNTFVGHMGEMRQDRKPEGKIPLEEVGINERKI